MPSLNELLKAAGLPVPDSINLTEMIEECDEVKGLVQAKTELLDSKNKYKDELDLVAPKLAQLEELVSSRTEEIEKAYSEKVALAEAKDSLSAKLAAEEEKSKALELLYGGMRESAKKTAQDKAVADIAGLFKDPTIGESFAVAKGFVNTEVSDNGDTTHTYKLGDLEFTDYSAFSEALSKDKTYGSHMKVGEASGPRINGSDPRPQTKEDPDSAFKERLASAGLTQQ